MGGWKEFSNVVFELFGIKRDADQSVYINKSKLIGKNLPIEVTRNFITVENDWLIDHKNYQKYSH